MTREWANRIADRFESGELIWGKGSMVSRQMGVEGPAFCVMGAMVLDCGFGVEADPCTCDEKCDVVYYNFTDWNWPESTDFTSHRDDFADWLNPAQMGAGASIVSFNDYQAKDVYDVIAKLREFAGE